MHGFITNNEANNISGISQLRARGQVHRQVETGVEQEGFQKCGSYLLLQWVITVVVRHDDLCLTLKVFVFFRPAECFINLRSRCQGHKDIGIRLRVYGFHEGNVGVHRFLMHGFSIGQQRNCAHRALDGVQESQASKHTHGGQLFLRSHLVPALNVIGYWNLFWQPEVTSQTVPNFQVFLVGNDVPVNRFYRICVVSDVLVIFIRHEINLPCSTSKVLLFQPPSIPNN